MRRKEEGRQLPAEPRSVALTSSSVGSRSVEEEEVLAIRDGAVAHKQPLSRSFEHAHSGNWKVRVLVLSI